MKHFCAALAVVSCLCLSAAAIADFESSPNTFLWIGGQSNDWRDPANWLASPHSDRDYPHTAMDAAIIGGPHSQANDRFCDVVIDPDEVCTLGRLYISAGCNVVVTDGTVRIVRSSHQTGLLTIEGNPSGDPGRLLIEDDGAVDLASSIRHEIGGIVELRKPTSLLVSTGEEVTLGPWRHSPDLLLYGNVKGLDNHAMICIQAGTTLVNQITISGGMIIDAVNVLYVIRRADPPPDAPPDDPPAPEHSDVAARHDPHGHVSLP